MSDAEKPDEDEAPVAKTLGEDASSDGPELVLPGLAAAASAPGPQGPVVHLPGSSSMVSSATISSPIQSSSLTGFS